PRHRIAAGEDDGHRDLGGVASRALLPHQRDGGQRREGGQLPRVSHRPSTRIVAGAVMRVPSASVPVSVTAKASPALASGGTSRMASRWRNTTSTHGPVQRALPWLWGRRVSAPIAPLSRIVESCNVRGSRPPATLPTSKDTCAWLGGTSLRQVRFQASGEGTACAATGGGSVGRLRMSIHSAIVWPVRSGT